MGYSLEENGNNKFSNTWHEIYHNGYNKAHGGAITHELYAILILRRLFRESVKKVDCIVDYRSGATAPGFDCEDDIIEKFFNFVNTYYSDACFLMNFKYAGVTENYDPLYIPYIKRDYKRLHNYITCGIFEANSNYIESIINNCKEKIDNELSYKEKELIDLDKLLRESPYYGHNSSGIPLPDYIIRLGEICMQFLIRVMGISFISTTFKGEKYILTGRKSIDIDKNISNDTKTIIYIYKRLQYTPSPNTIEYEGVFEELPALPLDHDVDNNIEEYVETEFGKFEKVIPILNQESIPKKYQRVFISK